MYFIFNQSYFNVSLVVVFFRKTCSSVCCFGFQNKSLLSSSIVDLKIDAPTTMLAALGLFSDFN